MSIDISFVPFPTRSIVTNGSDIFWQSVNTLLLSMSDDSVDTTLEEREGFAIVRAILVSEVPYSRIVARDTKSYFGVLLDDNNRKPICRFHFNRSQKYLGLLDDDKIETRIPLAAVEDIYLHSDALREAARRYR